MNTFSQTIWLVPMYAVFGALLTIPWSPGLIRSTGPRPAGYINLLMSCAAFIHSLLGLREVWDAPTHYSLNWLHAANLNITFDVEVSATTVGALVVILGLNILTQIYAIGYLEMDWGWPRFYALLAVFEAGMATLMLTNSLFFSYVMLEILTLGTYLLIGFWFNQSLVVTGARDGFLTKRVGDLVLLMAVVALYPLAGTWNYDELTVWASSVELSPTVATLLGLALLAGPLGKCAQFPLQLWLDEAMEGPMPATVLRNSIVVSTGAWVLIKMQPVLELSPLVVKAEIAVGAFTAVTCAAIALAQVDIKRVFSYATSSYLGIVFIAVGTGNSQGALMLLLTYAIAMALMLMAVGGIILNNVAQDITQLGGLWSRRPISGICYVVGALSLVAVPPLGCFWGLAKIAQGLPPTLLMVLLVVNGLTACSLARVFGHLFTGSITDWTKRSPEGLWALVLPMMILLGVALHLPQLLAVVGLLPGLALVTQPASLLLIGSTAIGAGVGLYLYGGDRIPKPIKLPVPAIQDFFAYDLYTAKLYKVTVIALVGFMAKVIDWCDRTLVDGAVNFVGLFTIASGESLKYNTTGQVQFYALSILFGTLLFGLLLVYPLLFGLPQ
ncbi:NAD(P)H-quinone oxidoreductase subunit F [Roseofilum capinflatum]|uniref:NAD(P)H-quinone oxidoreductase subunit F n=1 Tax=Roseofilum capinflatum BLCC-M114 TaxID=3022440 RepID=A0ABT7BBQ0_9CYAN|nr:NAD(P)H-quinone oxidoreductase subunit F [Roseofilum capinflatum]MDJ1176610.1 NAD(P)H-quinone oxidoreductase subunit F [Roseofilum capinflatum BLCC-M114]